MDNKLLKYCNTPRQEEYLQAVSTHGSNKAAARALNVAPSTIDKAMQGIKQRAAAAGYSPEHGLKHEAPAPFGMKGYSHIRRDEDGKMIGWDKYVIEKDTLETMMKTAIQAMVEDIPKYKLTPLQSKPGHDEDLMNLYTITDYHLGMRAWAEQSGHDWDMNIAEEMLVKWFEKALQRSPEASHGVFAQLGDFLHFDGLKAVTPGHGHVLESDTNFQNLVRVAVRVIRRVIDMMLAKYPTVTILMCEGNHDLASSVWLREWLHAFYEDDPRIEVNRSIDPYYVMEHGLTSLFFHHGHKRRISNVDSVFVSKYREIFGRTKYSYGHMGHLHHTDIKETNLMVLEQHRTLAAEDEYASSGGWMSGRDASCITYSKKYGYDSRIIISPEAALL